MPLDFLYDPDLDLMANWRPSTGDSMSVDYETKSDPDLTKVGLDVYTLPRSNPGVLMGSYRLNTRGQRGQLRQWQTHIEPPPREFVEACEDPHVEKWAFNAQFERTVTNRVLGIKSPIKGWRCSMVLAYMHSFTGGLEQVGAQIGLPEHLRKKRNGQRLIDMFTMPQRQTKNQPYLWRNWLTDPYEWEEFCDYNRQDVIAEEFVKQRLIGDPENPFPILPDEWDFYELDQQINDRGMPADPDFINGLIELAERRKAELLWEMQGITRLDNPNSSDQLLPWLQRHGYPYDNVRKENIDKALNRSKELWDVKKDIPDAEAPDIIRVMRRRQWSAVRSTDKAYAARRMIGPGSVIRFMYQFGGASRTLRFSGRGVQPQNMKRTPKLLDPEHDDTKLSIATDLIRRGDYDGFDLFINEPMEALTGCMRGLFRAPPGYELRSCDYKSVETAGLAWLAQCPNLLKIFSEGLDPYRFFGSLWYKKPMDQINSFERQLSKPPMLACGYRLSPGENRDGVLSGLIAYADNMGVPMTQEEATAAVTIYRTEFPEVKQFWYDCEDAVRSVLTDGNPVQLGFLRFEWMKPYLLMRLPSGRYVYYYKPRLEKQIVSTGRFKTIRSLGMEIHGRPKGELFEIEDTYVRHNFSYMGRNQNTTQWERVMAHGGVTTENAVQALTRDVLKVGLTKLDKEGYDVRGHSHDEGIALQHIGDNYYTLQRMREIYREPIGWAPGFPLDASGWEAPFYRKA